MSIKRRVLFRFLSALPLLSAGRVLAAEVHYPLHCDPELAPALDAAAQAFLLKTDIRVHVLATSDGLLVPQIAHVVQSDIVMTRADTVTALEAIGHKVEGAPHPRFGGMLVLAALAETTEEAARGGPIAAPDPLPNAPFDSAMVLDRMGLSRAHIMGAIDTEAAAALVVEGSARSGLVYLSDVRADPRLKPVAEAPFGSLPPIIYVATTTQTPRRPQPEAFVAFLASPDGAAILARFGLDLIA